MIWFYDPFSPTSPCEMKMVISTISFYEKYHLRVTKCTREHWSFPRSLAKPIWWHYEEQPQEVMSALAHETAAMSESLPRRFYRQNLTSLLQGMLMDEEWKGGTWPTHGRVSSETSAAHAGWVWNASAMEDLLGQVIPEHSSHRFWLQGTSGAAKRPLPNHTPHYILWGQSRFPVSRNKDTNHSERLPRK